MKNIFALFLVLSFVVFCSAKELETEVIEDSEIIYESLTEELEKVDQKIPERYDNLIKGLRIARLSIIRQRYPVSRAVQIALNGGLSRSILNFVKKGIKKPHEKVRTAIQFNRVKDNVYSGSACAGKVKSNFLNFVCVETYATGETIPQYEYKNVTVCVDKEDVNGVIVQECHEELRAFDRNYTEEEKKTIEDVLKGKCYVTLKEEADKDKKLHG